MKRKISIVFACVLATCFFSPSVSVLADSTSYEESVGNIVAEQTMDAEEDCQRFVKYNENDIPKIGYEEEILDFIGLGSKEFEHETTILTVEDIIGNTALTRAGEVTGTFTSAEFDTGTPGVTWYYDVDYTIAPMSDGIGWYFKDVDVTCHYKKGWTLYTWASSCQITWEKATYTLSPSSKPTSITVKITLGFEVVTSATGASAVSYSEDHEHTTTVSNVYS